MHMSTGLLVGLLAAFADAAQKQYWGFEKGYVSIQPKGDVEAKDMQAFLATGTLMSPVIIGPTDTLKLTLIALDGKQRARPHQAFLTIREPTSGLEDAFPLTVKATGEGKLDLAQKDIPTQLLHSRKQLEAYIVIGSFGSSLPLDTHIFDVKFSFSAAAPLQPPAKPLRYGKLEEIHHIFRPDPQSPPKAITLAFVGLAVACLPALGLVWLILGANMSHLSEALSTSPLSHATFVGSIFALEGIFFMYYTSWTLFQLLPAVGVVGLAAFLSGSKALSEVQGRRLAGKR